MEQKPNGKFKNILGVLAIVAIASTATTAMTFAAEGNVDKGSVKLENGRFMRGSGHFFKKGMKSHYGDFIEKHHEKKEKITEALKNGNYEEWVSLMGEFKNNKLGESLNLSRETFDTLREVNRLREAGEHDKAHELMKKLFGDEFKSMKHKRFMNQIQGG